jgi:hypothetical protein
VTLAPSKGAPMRVDYAMVFVSDMSRDAGCAQAPRDVFGAPVAQYADPDGLVFSVGQERQP